MRTEHHEYRLLSSPAGRANRWLGRVLFAAAAVSFALIAFFFLTVALIAGTFIALAIGARIWWLSRKLRAQAKANQALEGEYTVVERERVSEFDPRR